MTKIEMLAKLKCHNGVSVEVLTDTGNIAFYFY